MGRFKKVAINKGGDKMIDDLYAYEEPPIDKNNLDLAKINIYLHQL